ncbi:hypothetical protein ABIB45_000990 [Arthrobacter sp. UYCo732]
MKNPEEAKPDPDTEMSYAEAVRRKQAVTSEEPVKPKEDVQEGPGSVLREGPGE